MSLPRGLLGMSIAHAGLGVLVIALSSVESFTLERDAALAPGQSVVLGAYEYRFDRIAPMEGPNYDGLRADVSVRHGGRPLVVLHPEKRRYWVQGSVQTHASIRTYWGTNVFVALGDDLGGGRWSLRAQVRPLIDFLWLGAFVMAFGGAVALSDRRYRTQSSAAETAAAAPGVLGEAAV